MVNSTYDKPTYMMTEGTNLLGSPSFPTMHSNKSSKQDTKAAYECSTMND